MGRVSDARQRLLDAAIELIWRESYGAVTVDDICEKAGVKKGSFYYFFKSKTELVISALETHWLKLRPELDRIFSPSVPPLDRLKGYFEFIYERQCRLKREMGCVPGCPYQSLGSETSNCDKIICQKIHEILKSVSRYFETALRDAQAEGLVERRDVQEQVRAVLALYGGALAQARIANDPEPIRHVFDGVIRILGPSPATASAA